MFKYLHELVTTPTMNVGDLSAGGITLAALVQALPTVSVVLSIIWVAIRIFVSVRDDIIKRGKKDGDK